MPQIQYSEKYFDDVYEYRFDVDKFSPGHLYGARGLQFVAVLCILWKFSDELLYTIWRRVRFVMLIRHVVLTPEITKLLPKNRLLSEAEWRALGVQQSRGWVHYAIHKPEPHIMLFRRPLNYQQNQQAMSNQAQTQSQPSQPLGMKA